MHCLPHPSVFITYGTLHRPAEAKLLRQHRRLPDVVGRRKFILPVPGEIAGGPGDGAARVIRRSRAPKTGYIVTTCGSRRAKGHPDGGARRAGRRADQPAAPR